MVALAQDSKLNFKRIGYPGIVPRGDEAAEIAGIEQLSRCGVDTASGGEESIQVGDGIGKVRMTEQVEELTAKFEGS